MVTIKSPPVASYMTSIDFLFDFYGPIIISITIFGISDV